MTGQPFCCLFIGNSIKGWELMASFASLFNFPLVVCNQEIKKLCDSFYPELLCSLNSEPSFSVSISQNYEVVFTNLYPTEIKNFFAFSKTFTKKNLIPFFLCDEELFPENEKMLFANIPIIFESTSLLSQKLKDIKSEAMGEKISVGNLKKEHFEKMRKTHHAIIQKTLARLPTDTQKILHFYSYLSSKEQLKKIAEALRQNTKLLLQVDLENLTNHQLQEIKELKSLKNIVIIDIPLSYALFDFADIYLLNADYSAIPALYFEKPTFFFEEEDKNYSFLKKIGKILDFSKNIDINAAIENYYTFDVHDRSAMREDTQRLCFNTEYHKEFVKKQIEETISALKDHEYPF